MACEQDEMAVDTPVCYYCNEYDNDLSWTDEEADHSPPHTDAGTQYIMENCLPGDRERWVEQIKEDLEAHKLRQQLEAERSEAASPRAFTSPATELEPSSAEKVDSTPNLCHICDEYFCSSHAATPPEGYVGPKITYCFDKPICRQCFIEEECEDTYKLRKCKLWTESTSRITGIRTRSKS